MHAGGGCCPVCHDVLGAELVMLPCGHQLCCRCSMTLIDRAPQSASPQVSSPIHSHSASTLLRATKHTSSCKHCMFGVRQHT